MNKDDKTKILVLTGKKSSGKTTAAHFVIGYTMTQFGRSGIPYLPTRFTVDDETGELYVDSKIVLADGNIQESESVIDLYSEDPNFQQWAHNCLYPYIKTYCFADMLKIIAVEVFSIPRELIYGSDQDKNQKTHIKWKDMCALLSPRIVSNIKKAGRYDDYMKVREFLQYFGTNVCRRIFNNCWVNACFNNIKQDSPHLAVISDCRFKNEVQHSKKVGAKIVKLERSPHKDLHDSETDLDKMHNNNFDLIIPSDVTIREKNQLILEAMYDWGWFDAHVKLGVTK
jgi:hypothetical protein